MRKLAAWICAHAAVCRIKLKAFASILCIFVIRSHFGSRPLSLLLSHWLLSALCHEIADIAGQCAEGIKDDTRKSMQFFFFI